MRLWTTPSLIHIMARRPFDARSLYEPWFGMILIVPLGIFFNEIWIQIQFWSKKMYFKISYVNGLPFSSMCQCFLQILTICFGDKSCYWKLTTQQVYSDQFTEVNVRVWHMLCTWWSDARYATHKRCRRQTPQIANRVRLIVAII